MSTGYQITKNVQFKPLDQDLLHVNMHDCVVDYQSKRDWLNEVGRLVAQPSLLAM